MKLYYDMGGWALLFAVPTLFVVGYAFGIWMGWLSTH